VRTAIRKHLGDFLALVALLVLALGIGGYILSQQRVRFPLVEEKPFTLFVELENAQAVQPGQGQTVRVAGVEVGQIGQVELEDGKALVELQLEPKYKGLVRTNATALLRTKTGLKDMFLEVNPGRGRPLPRNGRIRSESSAPDIDQDEFLSALDTDTRDYLKLLISGAGKGVAGRGLDLRETLRRFGPLHRDLARVTGAIARRRHNLSRLVHRYGLLTQELGDKDSELTRLVRSSNEVLETLASDDREISAAVSRLPGTLGQTETTLRKVDLLGRRLGPAAESLRPAFRRLAPANEQLIPLATEGTPIVRDRIRPFARIARPYTRDLGQGAGGLQRAAPDLTEAFGEINRLLNMAAYNKDGAEGLTGDLSKDAKREEGYLYWIGWLSHNANSVFSTADASGVLRKIFIQGTCTSLLSSIIGNDPALGELLNLNDVLADPGICPETAN
jgi:phospholipid/cholesterol/gamma-HCH transport system substrate-binding protein